MARRTNCKSLKESIQVDFDIAFAAKYIRIWNTRFECVLLISRVFSILFKLTCSIILFTFTEIAIQCLSMTFDCYDRRQSTCNIRNAITFTEDIRIGEWSQVKLFFGCEKKCYCTSSRYWRGEKSMWIQLMNSNWRIFPILGINAT